MDTISLKQAIIELVGKEMETKMSKEELTKDEFLELRKDFMHKTGVKFELDKILIMFAKEWAIDWIDLDEKLKKKFPELNIA